MGEDILNYSKHTFGAIVIAAVVIVIGVFFFLSFYQSETK